MTQYRFGAPLFCLLLSACVTQPPPDPGISLPGSYTESYAKAPVDQPATAPDDSLWWQRFDSPALTDLVEQAQAQSLDVAAAIARVHQAQARARIAGAALLPELDASVNASRQGDFGGDADSSGSLYNAGLNASYEVDFWGRNRALRNQALSEWQASRFERDTVRLTITASGARLWLQAIALQERVHLAQQNLQSAQRLLSLVEARYRAGAATPLELAQQRGLVASQRRILSAIRQQSDDSRVALNELLGQTGRRWTLSEKLSDLAIPSVAPGIPTELMARRPDIASAEARLHAANANVIAARAAMFPSLTLTGGVGASHDNLSNLLDNPVYSVAAGLTAPIFNAGRLNAQHELAQALREELLIQYHQSIVNAFGDVETALNAIVGLDEQSRAQAEELNQAKRALALAETRYKAGADSLLTLLDAQRTLYSAQDTAVQIKRAHLQAIVSLYQALGGGWSASASDQTWMVPDAGRIPPS